MDRVNALPKDLLVITGDIITGSVNDFWKRWFPGAGGDYVSMVIDALSRLNRGPKFTVLGNHDQWDGRETENRLAGELERIGIDVLRNRSRTMIRNQDELSVAGTDDVWFSCDAGRALGDIPPERFTILLSHSPDVRDDLTPHTKVELTLCGLILIG